MTIHVDDFALEVIEDTMDGVVDTLGFWARELALRQDRRLGLPRAPHKMQLLASSSQLGGMLKDALGDLAGQEELVAPNLGVDTHHRLDCPRLKRTPYKAGQVG